MAQLERFRSTNAATLIEELEKKIKIPRRQYVVRGGLAINGKRNEMKLIEIQSMFAQTRAITGYDPEDEWTWGFFFFDPDQDKLEAAVEQLEALGYEKFGYRQDRPPNYLYELEVRRTEAFTPHRLLDREKEMKRLAKKLGLLHYNGCEMNLPMDRMRGKLGVLA